MKKKPYIMLWEFKYVNAAVKHMIVDLDKKLSKYAFGIIFSGLPGR